MKKHVTINQVAEEPGVSIQTVSRVINNRYDVSVETRQRIQDAILRLGYQPNAIARGLASQRSRTLGLVTYDFTDYFFTQVVTGAEQEARAHDYFCMLGSTNCGQGDEPKYLRLQTERHVEGVSLHVPAAMMTTSTCKTCKVLACRWSQPATTLQTQPSL